MDETPTFKFDVTALIEEEVSFLNYSASSAASRSARGAVLSHAFRADLSHIPTNNLRATFMLWSYDAMGPALNIKLRADESFASVQHVIEGLLLRGWEITERDNFEARARYYTATRGEDKGVITVDYSYSNKCKLVVIDEKEVTETKKVRKYKVECEDQAPVVPVKEGEE